MDLIGSLVKAIVAGFTYLNNKDSRKYIDLAYKLKKQIDDEKKKPIFIAGLDQGGHYRNDAVIDDCSRQLCLLSDTLAAFSKN